MLAASQYDTLNIIRRLATTNTPQDRLAYQLLLRYTKKAACISGAGLLHAAAGTADASAFLELAERVALGEDRWAQSSVSVTTAAE